MTTEQIALFFKKLDFDFKQDLELRGNLSFGNDHIEKKLAEAVFFYSSPNQTNTSFYVITVPLDDSELNIVRRYIWNESKADLIFVPTLENAHLFNSNKLILYYGKVYAPDDPRQGLIDEFNISNKEQQTIECIKRWQFDSGVFWLNYHDFLKKVSQKSIDKVLVETLTSLKNKLNEEIEKEDIVQALIDRTLYIKYLEDNHIINSSFYKHYFTEDTDYETLLSTHSVDKLNRLFGIIQDIFNNELFDRPDIPKKYLSKKICNLLQDAISGTHLEKRQMSLFHFKFDIIPVEFISYIYEIFLSKEQKKNGIYYTPQKLAQLIVDDVIPEFQTGTVLDPSCGSGMFLTVAFQRLFENSSEEWKKLKTIKQKIEFKAKLLYENVFGIEKLGIARRFTIFSLSLQIFRDLDPAKIRDYIAKELETNGEVKLFERYPFFKNIKHANTLSTTENVFEGFSFDYVVGNPPFFEIGKENEEISFLNEYQIEFNDRKIKAGEIVHSHQISQCFFLKIKDWANEYTRFGFVSNSSNFFDDNSETFQDFFYKSYGVEKIYELSRVKSILFEKANETVVSIIFNNHPRPGDVIEYNPVDMGLFSEKPFGLLIIKDDKAIGLRQSDLRQRTIRLRDFLVGNEFDLNLIASIYDRSREIIDYIAERANGQPYIHTGGQIAGVEKVLESENISREEYNKNKDLYLSKYIQIHTRTKPTKEYNTPFISYTKLRPYSVGNIDVYVKDNSNFRRKGKDNDIYVGEKILWSRIGKAITAMYSPDKIYFDFDVHVIKLANPKFYYLFTALLNSEFVNYFITIHLRKRVFDTHTKIDKTDFAKIPIPNEMDDDLVKEISQISKELTDGKYELGPKVSDKLNNLIFDLYDLSYIERQRIKDYFKPSLNLSRNLRELEPYKATLLDSIEMYFQNPISLELSSNDFGLIIAKVSLNTNCQSTSPDVRKTKFYVLNEIFGHTPSENFLASNEKIFGKDCLYIIRKAESANWTETKAYEDGQDILKRYLK